jgi:hypothetical protein
MGAVTVFTVTLAPIIKVVDVLMERFMRKLQGRKQKIEKEKVQSFHGIK